MSRKKRRLKKKRVSQVLVIVAAALVLVIIVAAVILLLKSIKTLKSITLTPNFAETELDVNQDYVFSVKGNPSKASLKSLKYSVDDSTATFEKGSGADTGTAVLHTGAEGTVTLYVSKDKIKSNTLTFQVVDQARKAEEEAMAAEKAAQEAQLAAEAAAAEAEQEAAAMTTLVQVTGDNVRMRAEPNTDCEVVKTCKKGETYTKIENVEDWTKVDFEGRECYIKSEFLTETTSEEAGQPDEATEGAAEGDDTASATDTKKEEQKPEEKKNEEQKPAEQNNNQQAQANTQDNAQAQADALAKAQADAAAAVAAAADAQKQAEEAAKAAAASAGTVTINCADGPAQFSKAEYDYFVATWNYTGMPEEMMTHHSAGELHALYNNTH